MKIKEDLSELIGETPMLKLKTAVPKWDLYLKLEYLNPAGSFKDRTACALIKAAEKSGKLKPGMRLFESSSGNTAKALAMLAAARGYKFTAIVDKHAPADKLNAISAYGAELHYCEEDKDCPAGHLVDIRRKVAKELAESTGGINLDQYDNPENPKGFYDTLGKEIYSQLPDADYLIGTIGTGSSLSGAGRYMKEHSQTKIIALEPKGSSHFSPHGHGYFISGPGYPAGAVLPKNIDRSVFDIHEYVSDAQAFNTMRFFAEHKGLMLGDSSGMILYYTMSFIKSHPLLTDPKKIVLIIGDGGDGYLPHAFNDNWMEENQLIDDEVINELSQFYC